MPTTVTTYLVERRPITVRAAAAKSADLAAAIRGFVRSRETMQRAGVRTASAKRVFLGWYEGPSVQQLLDALEDAGIIGSGRGEFVIEIDHTTPHVEIIPDISVDDVLARFSRFGRAA